MRSATRDAWVLSVAEDGRGKRTEVGDFPLQKRGGLGTMAVPSGDGTFIVSALEVLEGDEVMVVTAGGKVARLRADEVPSQGRRTQGRALVELAAGDRVVEVTRAYAEKGGRKSEADEGEREGAELDEADRGEEEDGGEREEREEGDEGEEGDDGKAIVAGQLDLLE